LAKAEKADYDGAIADFERAIALRPDMEPSYTALGRAKEEQGKLEEAVKDYSRAIALNPYDELAFTGRGRAKEFGGDVAGGWADFDKAVELKPYSTEMYQVRGRAFFNEHEFGKALEDFRTVMKLGGTNEGVYTEIWLARAGMGEQKAADAELKACLNESTASETNLWALKVGRFLAGEISERQFLKAATEPDARTNAGHVCEANYYAGFKRLLEGDKVAAKELFEKSVATNKKGFIESAGAKAELKRLEPGGN
jgi:lipoprotein NlpI